MKRFQDRVAIVTGAGRGIGAACAERFAREGARVVLASRTRSQLEEVARCISRASGEALVVPADVGDPAQVAALFDEVAARLGPADVVVTAAAILERRPVEEIDLATFDRVMAVNVRGVFLCCQHAFRQMRGRGGAIVNVSSLGGVRSTEKFAGTSAYVASKAAVVGLTESLAVEGRPLGIRVNCIAPGAVATGMLAAADPSLRTSTTPDDIASMILFLADPAQSGKLNGSVLEVFSNE